MNELVVDVKLYGKNVGLLSWNEKRSLAEFQYYPDFFRTGLNVSPIIMPLKKSLMDFVYTFPTNKNDCFKGLPGMIADSLPDKYGNEIIDTWFAARGVSDRSITPLDRLCYIGCRAMGALEFYPSRDIKELNESTVLRMESLVDLADKVFRDREAFKENIRQEDKAILDILKVGTSAGGAKPKALIAIDERTNEVRSGQVKAPEGFTYWLLKFDGTTFEENGEKIDHPKGIGNIEYAYHKMAVDCNIQMTECRLLQERDSYHFMTKRFDRTDNGEKIHSQTLAAIAHYDRNALHSYEEAFLVMRKMGLNYDEMEQFFRRMVFNVISRNHDDHTKNHSFLMDRKGKWTLSPAYDICYAYSPKGQWTDTHQMSINGKKDNFKWSDLTEVGSRMDIKNTDYIIGEIVDVVSKWKEYAKNCGVHENHANLIANNHRLLLPPEKIIQKKVKNESVNTNSSNERKERISDITIIKSAMETKIRCKIDGNWQMGENLSQKDKKRYEEVKLSGNKSDIANLKAELAEKYFKNELDNTKKCTLKR